MPQELTLWDILRSPGSLHKIEEMESWLFAEGSGDNLFPVLCDIPVFQPDLDTYIQRYGTAILKTMGLFGTDPDSESRAWFLNRYGSLTFQEMPFIDSLIEGEGYPGFFDVVELPQFLESFRLISSDDLIFDLVGKHRPGLALDLGCGQGGMSYRMSRICTRVIGVDSHFFLAAMAQHHMKSDRIVAHVYNPAVGRELIEIPKEKADNVDIICADALFLPFDEPVFDWVHIGHLADLIPNPERILHQVMRILKPGGALSVSTPMDFENAGQLDEFVAILNEDFTCTHNEDQIPWLRYNHKRRWTIHEDWAWIGKLRKR